MKTQRLGLLGVALCFAAVSLAQVPADAPAGTTGLCKDGTYSQAANKRGACSGHQGVKTWYASAPSGSSSGSSSGAASAPPAAAAAPTAPSPPPAAKSSTPMAPAATKPAASGTTSTAPPANA